MINAVFQILIWLEIAVIAGLIGLVFAPASFWACLNRQPPVWTGAARSLLADQPPQKSDERTAPKKIVGQDTTRRVPIPFGEMG